MGTRDLWESNATASNSDPVLNIVMTTKVDNKRAKHCATRVSHVLLEGASKHGMAQSIKSQGEKGDEVVAQAGGSQSINVRRLRKLVTGRLPRIAGSTCQVHAPAKSGVSVSATLGKN